MQHLDVTKYQADDEVQEDDGEEVTPREVTFDEVVDGEDDEVRDEVDEDALHRVLDVVRDLEFHRCRVLCEQSDESEGQEETDDDDADGDSHSLQAFLEVLGGLSVQFFVHDRMTFPLEIQ